MAAIIDFFNSLGDIISGAVEFLISTMKDIVFIVKSTGVVLASIPSYFSWLPAELLTILLSIFAVVVIYKILGREG